MVSSTFENGRRLGLGHYIEREGGSKIEVVLGDIEKDAFAIAELFNQESAIEHLSGIAPAQTPPEIDIRRYRQKRPHFNILIAAPEEVYDFYKSLNVILLKTLDSQGKIDGTITVEKPGIGLLVASSSRLVVADRSRGLGKGKALARAATALILSEKGLGSRKARAAIILDVRGYERPQAIFRSLGYSGEADIERNCVSWSVREQRFVERNVQPYTLMPRTKQPVKDLERFLPKKDL